MNVLLYFLKQQIVMKDGEPRIAIFALIYYYFIIIL